MDENVFVGDFEKGEFNEECDICKLNIYFSSETYTRFKLFKDASKMCFPCVIDNKEPFELMRPEQNEIEKIRKYIPDYNEVDFRKFVQFIIEKKRKK